MTVLTSPLLKRLLATILSLLLGLGLLPSEALAISESGLLTAQVDEPILNSPAINQELTTLAVSWFPPFRRRRKVRDSRPANSRSAGRRGQCNALNQSFVALVPYTDPQDLASGTALGFTAQTQPKIFVYLPDLTDVIVQTGANHTAQFMLQRLQGENEVDVLTEAIDIPLSNRAGIAEISFEQLGVTIEPDQAYHWYLSIICDQRRPSRNPSVDAWIEVVDADAQRAIERQVPLIKNDYEKIEFYIKEKGIWYETIALMAQLRCQEPNNVRHKEELKELLGEIFLDNESENKLAYEIANTVEIQQCPTQL